MKKILALLGALALCLAVMGCGGKNPCEEACEKMKSCGANLSGASCSGDCPAEAEKIMKCYAGLSCDDMKDAMKVLQCLQ